MTLSGPDRGGRLRFAALAGTAVLASFGGAGFAAVTNRHWYAGLLKPYFAPAPWLAVAFMLVIAASTTLSLYRACCAPDYHPDRLAAIRAILLALVAAAAWAWAFFVGRHPTLSLGLAVALVAVSLFAIWRAARVERRAAVLLLPMGAAAVLVALVDLSVRLRNG